MPRDIYWEVKFKVVIEGQDAWFADLTPEEKDAVFEQIRHGWLVGFLPYDPNPKNIVTLS